MKRFWASMIIALSATVFMFYQSGAFAEKPKETKAPVAKEEKKAEAKTEQKPEMKLDISAAPTIQIDKTSLDNGGTVTVTGTAPAGKPVYLEVWAEKEGSCIEV